jgi:hypothetical protein
VCVVLPLSVIVPLDQHQMKRVEVAKELRLEWCGRLTSFWNEGNLSHVIGVTTLWVLKYFEQTSVSSPLRTNGVCVLRCVFSTRAP